MDNTTTPPPTPTRARDAEIAAATAHLKESWELAREAAEDARRIARRTWHDLSRGADQLVEARPWTTVLAALGTGLAVGFLTGLLVSRAGRGAS
jgi:ElaB/YqjD/DUF883 family membrane-anchored ribosome-binding protein